MSEPTRSEALVFAPAESPAPARRALGMMVGVSLFGHALGFYVLQTFYAPAGVLSPTLPSSRWTLVQAGSTEAAALDRWLEVADPALGAGATLPRPADVLARLPPTPYVPSFQARSPLAGLGNLGDVTANAPDLVSGSVLPVRSVRLPRDRSLATSDPEPITMRSRIAFPEALRRRLLLGEAAPAPPFRTLSAATLAELPRPTIYLVGAPPEGGKPFVFRESSSGVAAADEGARAYLESLSFAAEGSAPIVWGQVTVYWGRDAFR